MEQIVVTGYGLKIPGALTSAEFKSMLENGTSSLRKVDGIGPNGSSLVVGKIDNDFLDIEGKTYNRYTRVSRLALAATVDAWRMASLQEVESHRVGVIIGTSAGNLLEIEQNSTACHEYRTFPMLGVSIADYQMLSASIASHLFITGLNLTLTTGCTASLDAMSLGKVLLETNQLDACIVGGSDAPLSKWIASGFKKTRLIETNLDVGETGVPFSNKHKGFVMSEGAGILVMERESSARNRGAEIYGVIEKIATNHEPTPILQSETSGESMTNAINEVVKEKTPTYVNSQALGLKVNDQIEKIAHQHLFTSNTPITSIKGITGHLFASMGAIQAISSLLSIKHDFIPPTLFTKGDGFEDLPIVVKRTPCSVDSVLITSHGNSGNNTVMMIAKY